MSGHPKLVRRPRAKDDDVSRISGFDDTIAIKKKTLLGIDRETGSSGIAHCPDSPYSYYGNVEAEILIWLSHFYHR